MFDVDHCRRAECCLQAENFVTKREWNAACRPLWEFPMKNGCLHAAVRKTQLTLSSWMIFQRVPSRAQYWRLRTVDVLLPTLAS